MKLDWIIKPTLLACQRWPFLWPVVARIVATPCIANYIIKRAAKTPHHTITDPDDPTDIYMQRDWFWNPYNDAEGNPIEGANDKYPSIRVNRIYRPDKDRHKHDHPWDARTIILKGYGPAPGYWEERDIIWLDDMPVTLTQKRKPGQTATLNVGEYHNITQVTPGGVHTLFLTWKYQEPWGFDVNGVKIISKEYFDTYLEGKEI